MKKETVLVIGAGIIGLTTALKISKLGRQVIVLEKELGVAQHQTGRNSGVIHAGPYYRPGSLKARLCKAGGLALVEYAKSKGIAHRTTGKLIVATSEGGRSNVNEIHQRAVANDVDVELVGRKRIVEIEPNCVAEFGLHVKATGIIDYSQVSRELTRELEELGALVLTGAEVTSISKDTNGVVVTHSQGETRGDFLINAAGLQSDRIAKIAGLEPEVAIVPFRGQYFDIDSSKSNLVNGLIYPAPNPEMPFLGVHITKTLNNGLHAGPNAILALKREGYGKFDFSFRDSWEIVRHPGLIRFLSDNRSYAKDEMLRIASKKRFQAELSRLVTGLSEEDLVESTSGIRAQALAMNGKLVDDFVIQRSGNQIHVLNAPSPAATASFAIADEIAAMFLEQTR